MDAGYFLGITDFVFSCLCGGPHVQSSLWPKFALLFCTCRHAWAPGVERRPQRRPVRVLGRRHQAGAVLYILALRVNKAWRRQSSADWAARAVKDLCAENRAWTTGWRRLRAHSDATLHRSRRRGRDTPFPRRSLLQAHRAGACSRRPCGLGHGGGVRRRAHARCSA